jgi:hypothetical protein
MLILAALAFATAVPNVHAQPVEKNGGCQGPDGKFATASACKGAGPAPAVSSVYRLDSKGKCRDAKGKMVKADKCGGAENAPAKAPAKAAAAHDQQKP